ncbi:MAG: diacylglycerol kinase family protein [Bacteroidota bacterium]
MQSFFQQRWRSFGYAFKGIATLFRTQVHAWIHLVAMVMVIALGLFFGIKSWEWVVLILCITLVLAAEAFNTAIEFLTDLVSPDFHPLAGKAKDTAAAAVLISAIGAAIVGLIILGPYLLDALSLR